MAMRVVLGLLQLFVLAVSRGESVHVDSDHASLVSRPSKSCQDHAPLVCPPVSIILATTKEYTRTPTLLSHCFVFRFVHVVYTCIPNV